jgi:Transposase DDE domain.
MQSETSRSVCGNSVVAMTRELIECNAFQNQHRLDERCFVRKRCLTFPIVAVFLLQQTIRALQLHLHDFARHLGVSKWVSKGAWTQARAKMRHTAFIELNQRAVVEVVYGGKTDFEVRRWQGWRVIGIDSTLIRLPSETAVGQEFGWVECRNQRGWVGRYAQARLSVAYDVLNRIGLEGRLVAWKRGERRMGSEHLQGLQERDLTITDQGYAGYQWFAWHIEAGRQFVCRCERNTFREVRRLFEANQANVSIQVKLSPPHCQAKAIQAAGLPQELTLRLVTLRLPGGELEVLATSLLDQATYSTQSFAELYQQRWGIETFFGILKGRLSLENFSGRTVEAIRQEVHATVFLSNLETVITRPAQQRLKEGDPQRKFPAQVNHAVAFHAIKSQLLDLLTSRRPVEDIMRELELKFLDDPVSVRKGRNPPRKKKSAWLSYNFQRYSRKTVY